MNDKERKQFVMKNDGLCKWFTSTYEVVGCGTGLREKRIGIARFTKLHRAEIDKVIKARGGM